MFKNQFITVACMLASLLVSQFSFAGMNLDADKSQITFLSIKKGTAAEIHTFKDVSGSLSKDGTLKVNIKLVSVETNIAIRNERMQSMLFEVSKFPTATLTAKVAGDYLDGEIKTVSTDASLELHGMESTIKVEAVVARIGDKLLVSSLKPIILNATDLGLNEGIDRLMEVAKLPSIARAIPVTFVLVFTP